MKHEENLYSLNQTGLKYNSISSFSGREQIHSISKMTF